MSSSSRGLDGSDLSPRGSAHTQHGTRVLTLLPTGQKCGEYGLALPPIHCSLAGSVPSGLLSVTPGAEGQAP